jgi:hypothetical protein
MAESKHTLSLADKVALIALIGGALATALPLVALTRSLILLFALGGALVLCHRAAWPRWKKFVAATLVVIAYAVIVLLLFEKEARDANTVAPTTFVKGLINLWWGIPWRWVLPTIALTIGAVLLILRRGTTARPVADNLSNPQKRIFAIAQSDKAKIKSLVRIAGISYQPNFEKAYIDFVVSVFNISIYDLVIDNKIKGGTIRFGEDWDSFEYEPKIRSDGPILCPARSDPFFIIRQPVRFEEIDRLKANDYLVTFDDLHIDFRGTEHFPEIETGQLDFRQIYLETRKGGVRYLDRLELIFMYSEEQWTALRNGDEISALKIQVKALEERAQKYGLTFEIDEQQTRVGYRGESKDGEHKNDSRLIAAKVRLRCSKIGDSNLAIREFVATIIAAGEDRQAVFAESVFVNAYIDSTKERVDVEKGWTITDPLTGFRVYDFLFDIPISGLALLTPRDHFFRVTMDAIGQNPQHIEFYVDNWDEALKSESAITLRRAFRGHHESV